MMNNMMNGMFGKIANGMCRLSMNGGIAINTSNGYKTYNVKTGRLTNCDNFVFDIGQDFFFLIPTNKVEKGDIIIAGGKPRCVIDAKNNEIKTFCYENSEISTIVPEHHVFFGKTYFYGKIVSMFGSNFVNGKGSDKIMKYMMLNSMMNGNGNGSNSNMNGNNMLPMMMMMNGGGFGDMFSGLFDDTEEDVTETEDEIDDEN